ncbi:MAG TPA: TlpA disulfide reductase family protein [Candidatus Saccharimonadales bacterium]|nr:TlpA disulfide reductase family protein [Candidatus Saccharimonadales bacterium]
MTSRWLAIPALIGVALAALPAESPAKPARRSAPPAAPLVPVSAAQVQALAARPGARATLVNVWATWCIPCRKEMPVLLQIARAHAAEGLRLVLVSADFPDQQAAARRFLAAQGVADTTYLKNEDDMPFINALSPRWTGALPATFIYGRGGHLATFWEGEADSARFEQSIRDVLAASPHLEDTHP